MLSNIRDRLLSIQLRRDEKEVKIGFIVTGTIIIFLLANVFYLNFILVNNKSTNNSNTSVSQSSPSISPSITVSPTPSPTPTPTPESSPVSSQTAVKDYFIPLGSGSNQSSEWADIPGAQVTVHLGQYKNLSEIHLQRSVNNPTANGAVYVRLYNVTDKHPVWYSEVSGSGSSTINLTSAAITYDTGSKTYQVQMKTQLNVSANLVQSRIHITVK